MDKFVDKQTMEPLTTQRRPTMTNAPTRPQFEGQIVKFKSPYSNVILYDICKINTKYGWLEWWALNDPTEKQKNEAMWAIDRNYL
jgi:hypothetical protein